MLRTRARPGTWGRKAAQTIRSCQQFPCALSLLTAAANMGAQWLPWQPRGPLHMRISFMPAHAHLIFSCSCASHFCLRIRISFLPAHAHLILTCSCASHFGLRMRISFRPSHAHLNLACACASYFGLHMKT